MFVRLTKLVQFWWPKVQPFLPWISLAMGIWSAFFISRSWQWIEAIAWMLGGAWILQGILLTSRALSRRRPHLASKPWWGGARFVLGMASQSINQEILFFLIPWWVRSTVWGSVNMYFTLGLVVLGVIILFDHIYLDRIVHSPRLSMLYQSAITFAGLAFLVPVLTGWHNATALAVSGSLSGVLTALEQPQRTWLRRLGVMISLGILGGGLAWGLRWVIPAAPLRANGMVFCTGVSQRTPLDTLQNAHVGNPEKLWIYAPIFAPKGLKDSIELVWSRNGQLISRSSVSLTGGRWDGFRTWSWTRHATQKSGEVQVDARTSSGQLLGRVRLRVETTKNTRFP